MDYLVNEQLKICTWVVFHPDIYIHKHTPPQQGDLKRSSRDFYNQERKDEDIQRTQDAAFLWSNWVQKWKVLLLNGEAAAQRENRDPVEVVETESVVDAILASYVECKSKKITSIFFNALHVFRQYSNWLGLVSELDCLMAVVGPVLNKIMALQQKIKRTCITFYLSYFPI
ncbi:MAG: hypothetical protein JOS17DRAFT_780355 [Linnemannia elongata]|nr:MAG: hypothetical protein JOS17DRAFT_780355 [Linnemannia elongata]